MATSGTVSQTIFTTRQVIDRAMQRAKIPAEAVSGEQIDIAGQNLWLLLMELASQGVPVWKIQTQLLPLYQGQGSLPTLTGTLEILNVNLRTMQRLGGTYSNDQVAGTAALAGDGDIATACTQVLPNGSITLDMGGDFTITTIGLLPNVAGVWNFVYEISQDGTTWFTVDTFTLKAVQARVWIWNDYEITRWPYYQFARVRATAGTILDVAEFFVANTPNSIPMAPLNKDDWFNLPNKTFQGRPVQYWQDMVLNTPVLRLWPVPDAAANFQLVEGQSHQEIQDVGSMTQQLDIPKRWFNPIVWSLAKAMADDTIDYKGDISYLKTERDSAMRAAWGGVTPKGPIYIQPNISRYTRG